MRELTEAQKRIKDSRKQREEQKKIDDEIKQKRDVKIGMAIVLFVIFPACLFVVVYGLFFYENRHKPKAPKKDQNTIWIDEQFSAWNGEHTQLGRIAKLSLKFPDTYEHIETKYWDNKEGKSITVKSYFNGKNAFGVPQRQCLMATYSYLGSELKTPEACI